MGVRTRFLVISDTHGIDQLLVHSFDEPVDVAIHCGDLTEESKLNEFQAALRLLRQIKAPLKLVIAGNHDWTLDTPTFHSKVKEVQSFITHDEIKQHYGDFGKARRLFDAEKDNGIVFMDEGIYRFTLANGAVLKVYASPYSLSLDSWGATGEWGFQYSAQEDHD